MTKHCEYEHCGQPIPHSFYGRRTRKYCSEAHRQAAYELRKDPGKFSPERRARRDEYLEGQAWGNQKKWTRIELARAGLGFDDAKENPGDVDQDIKRPYDVRWVRKYAKKQKTSGKWRPKADHTRGVFEPNSRDRRRYVRGKNIGAWTDHTVDGDRDMHPTDRTRRNFRHAVEQAQSGAYPVYPELEVALLHSTMDERTRERYRAFFAGETDFLEQLRLMREIEQPANVKQWIKSKLVHKRYAERTEVMTAQILDKLERIEQQQARDALLASMRAEAQDSQMRAILARLAGELDDDELTETSRS